MQFVTLQKKTITEKNNKEEFNYKDNEIDSCR